MPQQWIPFSDLDFGKKGPPTDVGAILGSVVTAKIDEGRTVEARIIELDVSGPPSRERAKVEWSDG